MFLKEFIEKYKITNKNILGIIDKNPARIGKKVGHYLIYIPEDLKNLNPNEIIITVIKANFKESIQDFMTKNGIEAELISLV